jgi:hypothetical protein
MTLAARASQPEGIRDLSGIAKLTPFFNRARLQGLRATMARCPLVRFNHVASIIVNVNHSASETRIDAAMIFARANFVKVHGIHYASGAAWFGSLIWICFMIQRRRFGCLLLLTNELRKLLIEPMRV